MGLRKDRVDMKGNIEKLTITTIRLKKKERKHGKVHKLKPYKRSINSD